MSSAKGLRMFALLMAAAWGLWELRQSRRNRRVAEDGAVADRGTFPAIYAVTSLGIAGAAFLGFTREPRFAVGAALTGLGLMAAGFVWRWRAMQALAGAFTHRVTIVANHELYRAGPYARVRHPAYAGQLVFILGLGVAMGDLRSVVSAFVPALLVLVLRIRVEERVLERHFGDAYRDYARATWRLFPGLW